MVKNKTIGIVAYKGKSTLSKLIKWRTNGEYSHTEFVNNFKDNEFGTYGAINFKGVQFADYNWHIKGTEYDVFAIDVTEAQFDKFKNFLNDQLNKKYDIIGILGYIDNRVNQDDSKWYCSELCYEALQHIGIELFNCNIKHPSPSLIVISPLLRLVRSGIVLEELDEQKIKADKDMDELLRKVKENSIHGDKLEEVIKDE